MRPGRPVRPAATAPAGEGHAETTWVSPGGEFTIDKRTIPGGMVYITSSDRRRVYGHVIRLGSRVDWDRPDAAGRSMDYWPSWDSIGAEARAAYLGWLLSGRRDPDVYIGYVFLYFYGLERRLADELATHELRGGEEATAVRGEVEALLDTYGHNTSFCRYASALLDFCAALGESDPDTAPSPEPPPGVRPSAARVAVGKLLNAGLPIGGGWALAYLRSLGDISLPSVAQRCPDEFGKLFERRWRDLHGKGLIPARQPGFLMLEYSPAAADGPQLRRAAGGAHHPDRNRQLGAAVSTLARECATDLAVYSGLPASARRAGTAAAVAALPDDLLDTRGGPMVAGLLDLAAPALGAGLHIMASSDDIARVCFPQHTGRLSKRQVSDAATLLERLGAGIEPDCRLGTPPPPESGPVVLFRLPDDAPPRPSGVYPTATLMARCAALVAASDGAATDIEARHLAVEARRIGVADAEQARLLACFMLHAASDASISGIKRQAGSLTSAERVAMGEFLAGVAAVDGPPVPAEITMLSRLYECLGLHETDLYQDLHSHSVGHADDTPVEARAAEPARRWAIPAPPAADVVLDPERIAARIAESARVEALLSDILADDPDPIPAAPVPAASAGVEGLDAAHAALAAVAAQRSAWARSELEAAAADAGLPLLSGAVAVINEAAVLVCDEPLIEGSDPLEINPYAVEELRL